MESKENNYMSEDRKRLGVILGSTRTNMGKSQEFMAIELGVARKTIQNWEKGSTSPSIDQVMEWFRALKVSPLPYMFQYLFPDLQGINDSEELKKIKQALFILLDDLPLEGIRQLLYLFYGGHGSSPRGILNLMTAHLQTPMKDRVTQAGVIIHNYEMAAKKNTLSAPTNVQPNLPFLKNALQEGENAVLNDSNGYMSLTKDIEK